MADEISVNLSLIVNKGSLTQSKSKQINATLTGNKYSGGVQNIGTTHEQIILGADIGTPGWAWFINLDSANAVEIGILESNGTTFRGFGKLLAGWPACLPLSAGPFYAKADTAAVDLEFLVFTA